MEEGTSSAWLHELLSPHVDELVVVGVTESRGPKSDQRDAFGLAEALRIGAITTPVFKAPSRFALLRELARTYSMLARDVVRIKNRLKSVYRSQGVPTPGKTVYGTQERDAWLAKLPNTSVTQCFSARTANLIGAGTSEGQATDHHLPSCQMDGPTAQLR